MLTKVLVIDPSINGSYVYYGILTVKPTLELMFDDDDERRGRGRRGGGGGAREGGEREDQDGLRSIQWKKRSWLEILCKILG